MGFKIEIELTDEQIDAIVLARMGVKGSVTSSKGTGNTASGRTKAELQTIREWLRANDVLVSDRGRIAQKYLDQYDDAH